VALGATLRTVSVVPAALAPPAGRRERKKEATRAALVDAALALFADRGIDATTVDDITEAVDVSPRTFHRYFSSKEDVLFLDSDSRRDGFAAALEERPADEPLLESLRAACRQLASLIAEHPEHERGRMRIVRGTPSLHGRSLQHTDEWAEVVAAHAARRLRLRPDDTVPRLVGRCVVAALRTARERWLDQPRLDLAQEIDRCFDTLAALDAATRKDLR
jgi:AcrR family transcriptional regulator